MSTRTPIVRAIDIGYGACKFTRDNQRSAAYLTSPIKKIIVLLNEQKKLLPTYLFVGMEFK